jgi:hypothetical protein
MRIIDLTEEIQDAKERSIRGFGASCEWFKFVTWGQYIGEGFTHCVYKDTVGELKDQGPAEFWKLMRVDLKPLRYSQRPHTRGLPWHGAAVALIRRVTVVGFHPKGGKYSFVGWECLRLDGQGHFEQQIPDEGLRPWKGFKCKDISDRPILELLDSYRGKGFCMLWADALPSVQQAMPNWVNDNLARAKMGMLIRRGVVDGCDCGCRGDFTITEKGLKELYKL